MPPQSAKAASATRHLDELLAAGEPPGRMLAAMASSLIKLHHAGRLRMARLSLEEACRMAGVYSPGPGRRQHAHLGPARVNHLPDMLLKADLDLKGNSVLDPRVIFEQFLIALGMPRSD